MIYTRLCPTDGHPFPVIDKCGLHPFDLAYRYEPLVQAYVLPYWTDPEIVGGEVAAEAARIWYKNTPFSIDVAHLDMVLKDEDGVLIGMGGPAVRPRDVLRNLKLTLGSSCESAWVEFALKRTSQTLSTLLGPNGVKLKLGKGFKLELIIECQNDSAFQSCMEALACVVAELRAEGFVLSMFRDRLECECGDLYWRRDIEDFHDADCGRMVDVTEWYKDVEDE